MEFFDIVNEQGNPTGRTVSREDAHKEGILHRTTHVWLTRENNGKKQILLQKRSLNKDSFPGFYDTSSAGHIPAGDEPLPSAIRELSEELGVDATDDQMKYAGRFRIQYEMEFHGKKFCDNEVTWVYVYDGDIDIDRLTLQTSEVEKVCWFDLDEVWEEIQYCRDRFCVPKDGLKVLIEYLNKK